MRDGLSPLLSKYREMRRLRDEDRAGVESTPRPAMAALAARFPGALRQLDVLPDEEIAARLAQLEATARGDSPAPLWALIEADYHGRMRATLRVKRAVHGAWDSAEALLRARGAWAQEPDEPDEPMNEERLASIREPSGGRLNPQVLAAVAHAHDVSVGEVSNALFLSVSGADDDA